MSKYLFLSWFGLLFLSILPNCKGQNNNNPYVEFKPLQEKSVTYSMDCTLNRNASNMLQTDYHKLLGHTHKELERYLVNEQLLEIFVSVSSGSENYFLDLQYVYNTPKGVDSYGGFAKGSPVKMTLLNNEALFFNNLRMSRGKINNREELSYFKASYMLDKFELKELLESPIMKMEVTYLYGTETYEVENINLIRQLLQCLESKKS